MRQKLASYQDMRAMLANAAAPTPMCTAELIWVGTGSTAEELERVSTSAGKIVGDRRLDRVVSHGGGVH